MDNATIEVTTVEIPIEEYKTLLRKETMFHLFKNYVLVNHTYSICEDFIRLFGWTKEVNKEDK